MQLHSSSGNRLKLYLKIQRQDIKSIPAPVFKYLKKHYCSSVIDSCNLLIKTRNKMYNLTLKKSFLTDCLKSKVIPKWLVFRIENSKLKPSIAVEQIFIKNELRVNQNLSMKLQKEYSNVLDVLKQELSFTDLITFMKFVSSTNEKLVARKKAQNAKSLKSLISRRFGTLSKRHITNLSSYKLDEDEEFTLSLGLNFSLPPVKVNREEVFTSFEMFYNHIRKHKPVDKYHEKTFKANLISHAHSYSVNTKDHEFELDAKSIRKSVLKLKKNKDIIITKPDKGSGTVILNRSDYVTKMLEILSDASKFEHLGPVSTHDKTAKQEKDLMTFLSQLRESRELSEHNFKAVWPIGSQRPRLYGLPKTHKQGIPLRPILSLVGSAQHKLAKFLNFMLQPVTEKYSKFTIKDSFTFAEEIKKTPADDTYMVSFDVKSLFTNVPLAETINICAQVLFKENNNLTITKSNFVSLMTMATSAIQFSFNNEMYCQTDGVAMGSPLGPTLANIIMGHLECEYFKCNQRPISYFRYVDDCFILFRNKDECEKMFADFNNLHPSIKFTLESEENNKLPFLDILVERNNGEFLTSIYRKSTFTGQYINYHSFGTIKRKINLIRTLCERAIKICSPTYLEQELNSISKILVDNGYPEELINKTINRRLKLKAVEPEYGPIAEAVPIKLPFIGRRSYSIGKEMSTLVKNCYNSANVRVIFSSEPNFTPASKDPIHLVDKSMVVYHFVCHCGNDYIGQTSRRFIERRKEHTPKCVKEFISNPTYNYKDNLTLVRASRKSAVAKHLLNNAKECGKRYADDCFKIIRICKIEFQLKDTEAVLIRTLEPSLCVQQEFDYASALT